MKKVKIILTALALTLVLAGCSLTNNNSAQSTSTESTIDYVVQVTDATELANVANNSGLIFFYIKDGALGAACLEQVSDLAKEYKIKVYSVNIGDSKYLKNTTDADMQIVYKKLETYAQYLDDNTLVTPSLYEFKDGKPVNLVVGVPKDIVQNGNISSDALSTIKESYRPLFESQK